MDTRYDKVVQSLATASKPVCIKAEAGCGKTTAIARAVKQCKDKQLILTHTNAGVAALRTKLRKEGVRESQYRVDTIDGWVYKYASAFREISGLAQEYPTNTNGWNAIRDGANRLFEQDFIGDILQSTYTGVFVDEYQDCNLKQHEIILKICRHLPTRVLGDPMQAIFNFKEQPTVDWNEHVLAYYQPLDDLNFPHRWHQAGTNFALGESISKIRQKLDAGESVNLQDDYPGITWSEWSAQQEEDVCLSADKDYPNEQVVGIHASRKGESLDHETAKRLGGRYQCLETMDCYPLRNRAKYLDGCIKKDDVKCMEWNLKEFLKEGICYEQPISELKTLNELEKNGIYALPNLIDFICKNFSVYRRELFEEMVKTIQRYKAGKNETLEGAAWEVRTDTRRKGRKIDERERIISRLLLIKGLEFHHAIVLNADKLENPRQFYVAITRGSKSLIVLSKTPIFHWP